LEATVALVKTDLTFKMPHRVKTKMNVSKICATRQRQIATIHVAATSADAKQVSCILTVTAAQTLTNAARTCGIVETLVITYLRHAIIHLEATHVTVEADSTDTIPQRAKTLMNVSKMFATNQRPIAAIHTVATTASAKQGS
jgi:hypothetical protein